MCTGAARPCRKGAVLLDLQPAGVALLVAGLGFFHLSLLRWMLVCAGRDASCGSSTRSAVWGVWRHCLAGRETICPLVRLQGWCGSLKSWSAGCDCVPSRWAVPCRGRGLDSVRAFTCVGVCESGRRRGLSPRRRCPRACLGHHCRGGRRSWRFGSCGSFCGLGCQHDHLRGRAAVQQVVDSLRLGAVGGIRGWSGRLQSTYQHWFRSGSQWAGHQRLWTCVVSLWRVQFLRRLRLYTDAVRVPGDANMAS